jgi:hypothetical protein
MLWAEEMVFELKELQFKLRVYGSLRPFRAVAVRQKSINSFCCGVPLQSSLRVFYVVCLEALGINLTVQEAAAQNRPNFRKGSNALQLADSSNSINIIV